MMFGEMMQRLIGAEGKNRWPVVGRHGANRRYMDVSRESPYQSRGDEDKY